jgi:hypothetical protein
MLVIRKSSPTTPILTLSFPAYAGNPAIPAFFSLFEAQGLLDRPVRFTGARRKPALIAGR